MKDGLAGTKDDFFLPSIHDAVKEGGGLKNKHGATRKSRSTEETLLPSSRMFTNGKKLYSSAPTSESSTPFKLPSIQRSKSISVSNLAADCRAAKHDAAGTCSRAELTRSPSCPSLIDVRDDAVNGTNVGSQFKSRSVYSKKSWTGGISDSFNLKLPSIFHQRDFTSSCSTSGLTPRSLNCEREQTTVVSPCTSRRHMISKSDKYEQHRPQQSYALLLPMTTSTRSSPVKPEGKRKTKKRKSTKDGSEAVGLTNILKEKLLAIEVRESVDSSELLEEEEMATDNANDITIQVLK